MDNKNNYCIFCMTPMEEEQKVCPACKKSAWEYQWQKDWLRPQTILNDKYYVGSVLGAGSFGIVYLAYDLVLKQKVAIKEYFPRILARREAGEREEDQLVAATSQENQDEFEKGADLFIEEAKVLFGKFDVPGLCAVKDYFRGNQTGYLVMEYLSGGSLKEYLKEHQRELTEKSILSMMKPIMQALLYLHSEEIIHCDLSPDNIMLDEDGQVKLIDFGSAKEKNQNDGDLTVKNHYAPPEQYKKKELQGPWTDIYALCAIIYEMFTGEKIESAPERIKKDKLQTISRFAQISQPVEGAVMQGLSLDIQKRYFYVGNLMKQMGVQGDYAQQWVTQTRQIWGELWLKITTDPELTFLKKEKIIFTKKRKRILVAGIAGLLLLTAGGYGGYQYYITHNQEKIFAYKLQKAMDEVKEHPDTMEETEDSPNYEKDLAFIKEHGKDFKKYTNSETYKISRNDAIKWKHKSTDEKMYLDKQTIIDAVLYYMNWRTSVDTQVTNYYTGYAFLYDGESPSLTVSLTQNDSINVSGGQSFNINCDVIDFRPTRVTIDLKEEDVQTYLQKVVPLLAPGYCFTEENVEKLISVVKEQNRLSDEAEQKREELREAGKSTDSVSSVSSIVYIRTSPKGFYPLFLRCREL